MKGLQCIAGQPEILETAQHCCRAQVGQRLAEAVLVLVGVRTLRRGEGWVLVFVKDLAQRMDRRLDARAEAMLVEIREHWLPGVFAFGAASRDSKF